MARALNIIAVFALVLMPILRPCDCSGFKLFCRCAIAQTSPANAPAEDGGHCTCCARKSGKSLAAKSSAPCKRSPGAPAKKKPCGEAFAQQFTAADVAAELSCVVTFPPVAGLASHVAPVPARAAPKLHTERPPPALTLIRSVRINL